MSLSILPFEILGEVFHNLSIQQIIYNEHYLVCKSFYIFFQYHFCKSSNTLLLDSSQYTSNTDSVHTTSSLSNNTCYITDFLLQRCFSLFHLSSFSHLHLKNSKSTIPLFYKYNTQIESFQYFDHELVWNYWIQKYSTTQFTLQQITLQNCIVTIPLCRALNQMKQLKQLTLLQCTFDLFMNMKPVKRATALEEYDLSMIHTNDIPFAKYKFQLDLPQLESFVMDGYCAKECNVTVLFQYCFLFPQLKHLTLALKSYDSIVRTMTFLLKPSIFEKYPLLESVVFNEWMFHDYSNTILTQYWISGHTIRELELIHCQSSEQMSKLIWLQFPHLQKLTLKFVAGTTQSFLFPCELYMLNLDQRGTTASEDVALQQCKNIIAHFVPHYKQGGMISMKQHFELKELNIYNCDAIANLLSKISQSFPSLIRLTCMHCTTITTKDVKQLLAHATPLQVLQLPFCNQIAADQILQLDSTLQELYLYGGNQFTSLGVVELTNHYKHLHRLHVQNVQLHQIGQGVLEQIKTVIPNCQFDIPIEDAVYMEEEEEQQQTVYSTCQEILNCHCNKIVCQTCQQMVRECKTKEHDTIFHTSKSFMKEPIVCFICKQTTSRQEYTQHIKSCHRNVAGDTLLTSDYHLHLSCEYCQQYFESFTVTPLQKYPSTLCSRIHLWKHYTTQCEKYIIKCMGCNQDMPYKDYTTNHHCSRSIVMSYTPLLGQLKQNGCFTLAANDNNC